MNGKEPPNTFGYSAHGKRRHSRVELLTLLQLPYNSSREISSTVNMLAASWRSSQPCTRANLRLLPPAQVGDEGTALTVTAESPESCSTHAAPVLLWLCNTLLISGTRTGNASCPYAALCGVQLLLNGIASKDCAHAQIGRFSKVSCLKNVDE